MRRFLLISYAFPPAGGGGVQRPAKFAKYISRHGWEPVVVCAKNPSAPSQDPSLLADLPPGLEIHRIRTIEPPASLAASLGSDGAPGFRARIKSLATKVLFPDRHVLWLPTALPGALRVARQSKVEAVMVTAPPFSSMLLGARVARSLGLPLVLDFRDEWSGYYAQGFAPGANDAAGGKRVRRAEQRLVNQAVRVIGASAAYGRRFEKLYQGGPDKYVWIPNGYDQDDFPSLSQPDPPRKPGQRLRLLYTGTIFPVTSLEHLWDGLALLSPDERRGLEVEICGRATTGQVLDPGLEGLKVVAPGYLGHSEVVGRMSRADALLLTLADLPGSERVIPGKLFEYLAARHAILALTPPGEAADIVNQCKAGEVIPPGRPQAVADTLRKWLARPPSRLGPPPKAYSRDHLAARLAEVLDQAAP